MHEVLVNRLGGLSLPRKSVVRLTDRPDMTLDIYRGRKTTIQYNCENSQTWLKSNQNIFYGIKSLVFASYFEVLIWSFQDVHKILLSNQLKISATAS